MRIGDVYRVERTSLDGSDPHTHNVTLIEIREPTLDNPTPYNKRVYIFKEDTGETTEIDSGNMEGLEDWLKLDLLRTIQNRLRNEMDT